MSSVDTSDREYDRCRPGVSEGMQLQRSFFKRLFMMIVDRFDLQMKRQRSRLSLLELTDEQLKDIGLSRGAIDGKFHQRSGI